MENTFIWVIGFLIFINAILIVAVCFFAYQFFKLKNNKNQQLNVNAATAHPKNEVVSMNKYFEKIEGLKIPSVEGDYCLDHPTIISQGQCAITSNKYCQDCLKTFQNIKIGKKFLNLFLASEWEDFHILPKKNIYEEIDKSFLDIKYLLWQESKIPVIIQNHFKINIQTDEIESFIVFKARKDDISGLRSRFPLFQNDSKYY